LLKRETIEKIGKIVARLPIEIKYSITSFYPPPNRGKRAACAADSAAGTHQSVRFHYFHRKSSSIYCGAGEPDHDVKGKINSMAFGVPIVARCRTAVDASQRS